MIGKINKSNKGFTIIEVMIVLAIAGLIILIVLLAVPALQRNGRNTAIKQDASAVSAAINEFKSNNDGQSPDTASATGAGVLTIHSTAAGTTDATGKIQGGTNINSVAAGSAQPVASVTSNGNIYVWFQHTCAAPAVTNLRAVSVYYPVEQASGTPVLKCIDS